MLESLNILCSRLMALKAAHIGISYWRYFLFPSRFENKIILKTFLPLLLLQQLASNSLLSYSFVLSSVLRAQKFAFFLFTWKELWRLVSMNDFYA
jgi:hypothetical protein